MIRRGEDTRGFQRTALQKEADVDDPFVTIQMFPVSGRPDRVFEATEMEWDAVTGAARQFAREMGYASNPPIFGDSGKVWLVTVKGVLRTYSLVCGAAEIDVTGDRPLLTWMWVHPN